MKIWCLKEFHLRLTVFAQGLNEFVTAFIYFSKGDQIGQFLPIGLLLDVNCDFLKRRISSMKWQHFGLLLA
jgi:hypothetical protein